MFEIKFWSHPIYTSETWDLILGAGREGKRYHDDETHQYAGPNLSSTR